MTKASRFPTGSPERPSVPPPGSREKRGMLPEDDDKRLRFRAILNSCHALSNHVEELSTPELQQQLGDAVKGLRNLSQLIGLMEEIESNEWNPELMRIYGAGLKYAAPTPKFLNDSILGYAGNNEFMGDLHGGIDEEFGGHSTILRTNFNRAAFVTDLTGANGPDRMEAIRKSLVEYHRTACEILERHTKAKQEMYQAAIDERVALLEDLHGDSSKALESMAVDREIGRMRKAHKRISDFLTRLEKSNENGEEGAMVEIGLSVDRVISDIPLDLYTTGHHVEIGTNMATFRRYTQEEREDDEQEEAKKSKVERGTFQEFGYHYLLADIIRTDQKTREAVLDDTGELKAGWEDYFELKEGDLVMNEAMIARYRNSDVEGLDEVKLRVFTKRFKANNLVDVIKDFTVKGFEGYQHRIAGIVDIMQAAKLAIQEGEPAHDTLVALLKEANVELGKSLKNKKGSDVLKTDPGMLQEGLAREGEKMIIYGDLQGFGLQNIRDYERVSRELREMVAMPYEEWNGNNALLVAELKKKFEAGEARKAADKILLTAGDAPTNFLHDELDHFRKRYGKDTVVYVAGDEFTAVVQLPNKPNKQAVMTEVLKSRRTVNARMCVVHTNFQLPSEEAPIGVDDEERDKAGVSSKTRKDILRLMSFEVWAELQLDTAKRAEKQEDYMPVVQYMSSFDN